MEEGVGETPGSEFQSQRTRVGYLRDILGCFPKLFWCWVWDKSSVVRWSWVQILIHGLLIPRQEQLSCPLPGATISRTRNGQAGSITLSVGARSSHTHKGASACLWQSLPKDLFVGPPVFCVSLSYLAFSPLIQTARPHYIKTTSRIPLWRHVGTGPFSHQFYPYPGPAWRANPPGSPNVEDSGCL